MTAGVLTVRWLKKDDVRNIKRGGASDRLESSWRQLPLWSRAPQRKMPRLRSSRSFYLWLRLMCSSSLHPFMVTELEFVRWMREQLNAAEFGALSLTWVKENARQELRIGDDQLFQWLTRHCIGESEFKSDGEMITLR